MLYIALSLSVLAILLCLFFYNFWAIFRYILIFMKDKVSHKRYGYLIDKLLTNMDTMNIKDITSVIVDAIHLPMGDTRHQPTVYRGKRQICMISHSIHISE